MIETVMIFALGFLTASLSGLLVLPAVNARARRLAQRRAESLLPMSAREIAAEKDFLRADFAVRQRRLERAVETARTSRQADMANLGARTLEAARLARDVEGRDARLAEAAREAAALSTDLTGARAEGTASRETLTVLEAAHEDLLAALLAARAAGRADLDGSGSLDPAQSQAAPDDEAAALRRSLAAAEEALARVLANGSGDIERENAELRARITEVADTIAGRHGLPTARAFSLTASS